MPVHTHPATGKHTKPAAAGDGSLPALTEHRVAPGETLVALARRYGTSVDVLLTINGLENAQRLRVGQLLRVPGAVESSDASWQVSAKPAKQKGTLRVVSSWARYSGTAVDSQGRLRPDAVRALNGLLGAGGSRPPLPERLIRILVEVSDTFGRPIRVVSGYRTSSYYQDSKHKLSSAVDFSVPGVPNAVLCNYLRRFENVGVGYYPNSTFVHLDVRGHSAYWVDYSGPGEPPRRAPGAPPVPRDQKRRLLADLDAVLTDAMSGIARLKPGQSSRTRWSRGAAR